MHRREFIAATAAYCIAQGCTGRRSGDDDRVASAVRLLDSATGTTGEFTFHVDGQHFTIVPRITAASLHVSVDGAQRVHKEFGSNIGPHTPFVLASISKPITAAAVMLLVDRQQVALGDTVHRFVPEFRADGRSDVTIAQLLSHTSGLPDGFPDLVPLLSAREPLGAFLSATYASQLLFPPGSQFSYSNLGLLLAGEVVERITGARFRDFLRHELFEPLGMLDSSLGLGGRRVADTAQIQRPDFQSGVDPFANSEYWRDIGAPWNGVHSTASDLAKFLGVFLRLDGQVLSRRSATAMVTSQTAGVNNAVPWGLGWMLKPGAFGKKCSPQTFGHHGLSGTIAWLDPVSRVSCVLLTSKPIPVDSRDGVLGPVSDHVAEDFAAPFHAGVRSQVPVGLPEAAVL